MSFAWKDKPIPRRRLLGYATVGLGAIVSALGRQPVQICLIGTTVIVIAVAGFLTMPQTPTVNAAPELNRPLDCISCHTKILKSHDKLGSGNKACWVCHDNTDMKMLRLTDETQLSSTNSPQLCGQCHQERYNAWKEGTHGIPGVVATVKCTSCHDPHQPQIALSGITRTHPPAQPPPASPSVELLVMLGIILLLITGVGAAVMKRGEET